MSASSTDQWIDFIVGKPINEDGKMSAQNAIAQPQWTSSLADMPEPVARRFADLAASDLQFRSAVPDPAVDAAKTRPGLGLAQIMAVCLEAYADRPALADRAAGLTTDPVTGRTSRQQLKHFEAVTYRDLWDRVQSLATAWYRDAARPLVANDMLCIIGFGGIDFATIDLAG